MAIHKSFSKFKLHTILLRVSSYCNVHDINHYITNVDGYRYEITKLPNIQDTDPQMCTFEDVVLNYDDKWIWRKLYLNKYL